VPWRLLLLSVRSGSFDSRHVSKREDGDAEQTKPERELPGREGEHAFSFLLHDIATHG
jgi:hypothetical protein